MAAASRKATEPTEPYSEAAELCPTALEASLNFGALAVFVCG